MKPELLSDRAVPQGLLLPWWSTLSAPTDHQWCRPGTARPICNDRHRFYHLGPGGQICGKCQLSEGDSSYRAAKRTWQTNHRRPPNRREPCTSGMVNKLFTDLRRKPAATRFGFRPTGATQIRSQRPATRVDFRIDQATFAGKALLLAA